MLLSVQETFAKYARSTWQNRQDVMRQVQEETDLLKLLDYVGNSLVISYKKKQKLLEAVTLTARYEAVLSSLLQETEILALKRDFQKKCRNMWIKPERLPASGADAGNPGRAGRIQYQKPMHRSMKRNCRNFRLPGEVKARIHKEIERFQGIQEIHSESTVSRGYIETLLELPWDAVSEDNKDLSMRRRFWMRIITVSKR